MKNHFYRSLLIIAVLVVAVVNVVPTVGWYSLEKDEKDARVERWAQEDYDRAGMEVSIFQRYKWKIQRWSEFDNKQSITLGIDLQGGIHMVVGFDELNEEAIERGLTDSDVQDIFLATIRNRIEQFDAQEPTIQALGPKQVEIQLPGQSDIKRAKELIFGAARLEFHIGVGPDESTQILVNIDRHFENELIPFLQNRTYNNPYYSVSQDDIDRVRELIEQAADVPGLIPGGRIIEFSPPPPDYDKEANYSIYVLESEIGMTGEGIKSSVARPDPESPGRWMILFEFNAESAPIFRQLTADNVGRSLAIVLDGNVMSAPNINEAIGASGSISGTFTGDEAKDLAISLNSGSMPVTPREDYAGIVGPTIGGESARQGVTSSVIGLALVIVFMVIYYHIAGLVAVASLLINATIILGAFAYFNTTLTLPGIAGLILTIGMAVDANVLIFERIREELQQGKSLVASIEGGYARASSAIWDANVTTLIAAMVLTQFGTGPVQGFAVALSIGVCSSVFAALVVTRAFIEFIAEKKLVSNFTMLSILKSEPRFEILGRRRIAAMVSIAVILVGVVIFASRGKDNFGVDFTNGTSIRVSIKSDEPIGVNAVRTALNEADFISPIVQESRDADSAEGNRFLIRIGDQSEVPEAEAPVEDGETAEVVTETGKATAGSSVSDAVQVALAALSTVSSNDINEKVEVLRSETVGPAVGAQLRRDAFNAIFFALFFIILYLWFRFEWKFAVGAVVALVHDVLIVIGILALFQREISIPVVAALLTIIGYSLNDTIVVFDRVREDLALNKSRGMNFVDMLNTSVNRTLSRTLLTSLTTLFVVIILFIFGGPEINDFALALIAGVLVGTYSSLFVATPVVNYLRAWSEKRELHLEQKNA
ncbi:MAG: protein translocase subunit SecD [Candidatus Hydrogenedentota bacterium]